MEEKGQQWGLEVLGWWGGAEGKPAGVAKAPPGPAAPRPATVSIFVTANTRSCMLCCMQLQCGCGGVRPLHNTVSQSEAQKWPKWNPLIA